MLSKTAPEPTTSSRPTAKVAVVIPIPNDPDWTIFEELSEDVQIIVVDDSNGKLAPAPRRNVRVFDYAAQERAMGPHYAAQPHKSAATRNFGHWLAFREGFDVIVALDYDCRTKAGWLDEHLQALGPVTSAPALAGAWINSIEAPGFYSRGFPYEHRNAEAAAVSETTATGDVKLNMGVWDHILDLNGIDKLQKEPPYDPGLRGELNYVALGNIPVCGMNTAFAAELTPAYYFLPDVWVDGWQLSRHDDIWGGYIVKKLMDKRGDLFRYGRPVVEHTRQTKLERVVMLEHWMHLMSREFYEIVDDAASRVAVGGYATMYAEFVEEYLRSLERSKAPRHYAAVYRELGDWMLRWSACFR
ncbi:MAG TPA: hypothetical protein VFM93_05915 [Candidatus Limnocylindria bacterium]|nr:hypothetical protein [Candidatus Limnocylindria bacterium]